MQLDIPELCLVMLVGPSASGKSTFARHHFLPTEVVSSDFCRAALADDENDQSVTGEAFELLHVIVSKRLKLGRLTVVDATNVQPMARKGLIELARQHNVFCVATESSRSPIALRPSRSSRSLPVRSLLSALNMEYQELHACNRA